MASLDFDNSTALSTSRLRARCAEGLAGWAVGRLTVRVRYSRGADFSGSCYYGSGRIFINIGRHVTYPYRMGTHVARARTSGRYWYKPVYTVELHDGYDLALFVFMHELYHLLVKRGRRNPRQKESMCDRFAARHLVDRYGAVVRCDKGSPVPRSVWDFQDLDGFVSAARDRRRARGQAPANRQAACGAAAGQLLLFDPA